MSTTSAPTAAASELSRRVIISYALPRFSSAMMLLAVAVYLPKFYTDTLLLAPAFIGWTFLIGRFWDGITDPVMGYISDATKWRMGRRRPYFLISAVPLGIAYFFLWSPPGALAGKTLFVYLLATYLLTYTFWTIFSIPHHSLGAELTMDYHARTLLTGVREAFGIMGTLVGTLAPPVFAAIFLSKQKGYSVLAALVGILSAVFILIAFFNLRENPEFQHQHPIAFREGFKAIFKNQPFRTLLSVFVIALMGNAFVPILTLYIADYVVKMPKIAPAIIVSYLLVATVSITFWMRLSHRIGKKRTLSYGLLISSAVFALSTYYHTGTWLIWIILAGLAGLGYACTLALAPSMLADVIDLDELQTGRRREGAYFGIWFFIDKAAVGVTAFIGLQTLDIMGYVPNQEQSLSVFWAMKVLYSIVPTICFALCYFLLRRYPITQEEHNRIRAEIEAKQGTPSQA